jgi:hypothetical protein
MPRVVMERSFERLALCYSDGFRDVIADPERTTWLLHEAEALVIFLYIKIFLLFFNVFQKNMTISHIFDFLTENIGKKFY